ncbi:DNA binding protein DnaJ, heat shock protein [Legionella geestiana]|uniref:DNA binding protein DnaJ, heat shock protein n=1 Tax=Legionella geestiana TaxID=45065 RepID=A0A0W0TU28_9GAMM|nr:co-chaperone DjlA [Legionella geestiana]KTC98923.1 DNA binding protein DnaJ, heat shock protein [Legionella geestiana]QBS13467.1 co-chaperone DjlA [Legionella geestiana]QDQ41051.1 co-chaperone DjlA [Legionella geestiana]STX54476.1 DNA binding protein DnaJ, heat shock protein [Legionella geestiana]
MNFKDFFAGNALWGKLLGAFFGYLMAGPAGALLGIIVGNFFDRGLASHFTHPYYSFHSERRRGVQNVFFEATFKTLGYIAKADGRVSEEEIRVTNTLMTEMGLNRTQRAEARKLFGIGKTAGYNPLPLLDTLAQLCRHKPGLIQLFVDIQYRCAQAGMLDENKLKALDTVFSRFGFAPLHRQYRFYEDFGQRSSYRQSNSESAGRQYHAPPRTSLAEAYSLLEVNPSANRQDVKRAYRRLMSRNHPDKLIAQGLPEAMIKMATQKTQAISKAYDAICESRGWK